MLKGTLCPATISLGDDSPRNVRFRIAFDQSDNPSEVGGSVVDFDLSIEADRNLSMDDALDKVRDEALRILEAARATLLAW